MSSNFLVLSPAALLLCAAGCVPVIFVLVVLHKRLKLFTKGTMTFMIAALMIVTVISVIEHLNDIRNAHYAAADNARTQAISTFLRAWFDSRDDDLRRASVPERAPFLDKEIEKVRFAVCKIAEVKPEECETARWTLVSLDLAKYWGFDQQGFEAVVECGAKKIKISGTLSLEATDSPRVSFLEADARAVTDQEWSKLYWSADTYQNPAYQAQAPRRSTSRRRRG